MPATIVYNRMQLPPRIYFITLSSDVIAFRVENFLRANGTGAYQMNRSEFNDKLNIRFEDADTAYLVKTKFA